MVLRFCIALKITFLVIEGNRIYELISSNIVCERFHFFKGTVDRIEFPLSIDI